MGILGRQPEETPGQNNSGILGQSRVPGPIGIEHSELKATDLFDLERRSKKMGEKVSKPEDTTQIEQPPAEEVQRDIVTQVQRVVAK